MVPARGGSGASTGAVQPRGNEWSRRTMTGHCARVIVVIVALTMASCGEGLSPISPSSTSPSAFGVSWMYDGQTWQASGVPPPCPTPLTFTTPVNLSRVTSILYPGQSRGGWYKPHGGFRFDAPGETGEITVVAPMVSTVYRASRALDNGEIQYMFDFINGCGILHRLGHLRDLSPRFQQIAASLPPAVEGDSRTSRAVSGQNVAVGETIGTAVGYLSGNFSLDWGVYDLRARNEASEDPAWLSQHPGELAPYAICWFDHLPSGDSMFVRSLPPADWQSGATSDYCR